MKILAVDDESLALESLVSSIKKSALDAEVVSFDNGFDAIEYCKKNHIDIAFLDITMGKISGMDVATAIQKINPNTNIIFSTGYEQYSNRAFDMHASGYITKPITPKKVKKEIDDLRYPLQKVSEDDKNKYALKVKCFGNFDVYDKNDMRVYFERQKAKELFAYLVFRQGASCTTRELAGILFDDGCFDDKRQIYMQKIVSSLIRTFKDLGLDDLIIKSYNSLSVNNQMIDCDYYRALEKKDKTGYMGEFIAQYSWAEEFNYFLLSNDEKN